MSKVERRHKQDHARQRQAARLRAVQALFQMDLGGMGAQRVIAEFRERRLQGDDGAADAGRADAAFFEKLVQGVVENQDDIDKAIAGHLAKDWRLKRLDTTLRALLRAATCEIFTRQNTPVKAILDAYTTLAGDFFEGPEPGFVNGVLDAIARQRRGDELAAP